MNQRTTCYFSGNVQGVGFRYAVMEHAADHDVTGFVRNLSDGRVELVMEGESPERRGLLEDVKRRMNAYIDELIETESPATGEFERFSIGY